MFLRRANFFAEEAEASLRNLDHGFIEPDTVDKVFEQVKEWPSILGADPAPFQNWDEGLTIDPEEDRIYMRDAERTFKGEPQRDTLIRVLSYLGKKQGDYHQGEGLVAGLLLLTFDVPTVISMLDIINSKSKFIPEFWAAASIGSAREGYVMDHLLRSRNQALADHLLSVGCLPETYCAKWFCGLNINLLPFTHLYKFFDGFFKEGHPYLLKYSLSLFDALAPHLLEAKGADVCLALLRLDRDTLAKRELKTAEFYEGVLDNANTMDLSDIAGVNVAVDNEAFAALRVQMYNTHLKARIERANQVEEDDSDSEIVFSDESSEEDPAERLARLAAEGDAAAAPKADDGVDAITKGIEKM